MIGIDRRKAQRLAGTYGVVFAIADSDLSNGTPGARAATITSLLMLRVPEARGGACRLISQSMLDIVSIEVADKVITATSFRCSR